MNCIYVLYRQFVCTSKYTLCYLSSLAPFNMSGAFFCCKSLAAIRLIRNEADFGGARERSTCRLVWMAKRAVL